MTDKLALEKAIDFIESLTRDPLLLPDDIEMTLDDVQCHARIELASIRKVIASPAPQNQMTREQQIVAMAKVLDECRWFKVPETGMEVKPLVWATRLWDAANPSPETKSVLGSIDGFKTFTPSSESLREYISDVGAIEGPKIGDGCLPPFFEDFGSAFIRQHRDIGMHNDLRENMRARSSPSRREIGDNIELERQSEIAMAAPPQTIMREV